MAELTQQQRLDILKTQMEIANVTPGLSAGAHNIVFGSGNPNADIVFIGEAPGKNEDLTGEPFVGAAGRVLDELLAQIGMNRDIIYITSIIKYRPPNNRDPRPDEKAASLPYLQAQLEIIQPRIVVTLGRHSTNCFLPDLQISKIHGQVFPVQLSAPQVLTDIASDGNLAPVHTFSAHVVPLYHPAAALYNNSLRQTLIDDFVRIPTIVTSLETL